MAATRWIVACLGALALAGCAARVQPRLDAGLGAGWNDGPVVGGNLGVGKYEFSTAAPPFASPAPVLPVEPGSSPPPSSPLSASPGDVAGPDSCAGGACVIPGPTAAPAASQDADGGGMPLGGWIAVGLALAVVAGAVVLALLRRKPAAPALNGVAS